MISIIASNLESEVKNPVRGSHRNEVGYVNDSKSSGARFSKLPVITGSVKLFCFPF